MVDFNNEATIGVPATDIVKVLILQRRYDVFESLEAYNKLKWKGVECDMAGVKARMNTLYLEVQCLLERRLPPDELERLKVLMDSTNERDIKEALSIVNRQLDKVQLTRIDTRRIIDTTRVSLEDEDKGL